MRFQLLAIYLAGLAQAQTNWTVGQTVLTSSGPVQGHKAPDTSVSEYLGIPFAKPPIGDLRWRAPVTYTGNATINGTNYVCNSLEILLQHQLCCHTKLTTTRK